MRIDSLKQLEKLIPSPCLPREIRPRLIESLSHEEVTIIYGARQVGKSVEVALLMQHLFPPDKLPRDIFYFNLDSTDKDFEHPNRFLSALQAQKKFPDGKTYVFLDEAQRLTNIGLFIKDLYDRRLPIKFILTGSASLTIKEKIKESLTGRKEEVLIMPLNLSEIIRAKGIEPARIDGNFSELDKIFADYLLFGGYPAVVRTDWIKEKKRKLLEITESYTHRDLTDLFNLENEKSLRLVATFLAESIGGLFSRENLTQLSGLSRGEIEKNLAALEKSFIIGLLPPFSRHRTKEMTHRPKIYFEDLGIRNALLRKLEPELIAANRGQLFENAVFLQLQAHFNPENIKFWRTLNQTEVDFIVEKDGGRLSAFEAKYSGRPESRIRSLTSFTHQYPQLVDETRLITAQNIFSLHLQPKG